MAIKPRLEYPGAIYHVMNRGDRREELVENHEDRHLFPESLGGACAKRGWEAHAWCPTSSRFHSVALELILAAASALIVQGVAVEAAIEQATEHVLDIASKSHAHKMAELAHQLWDKTYGQSFGWRLWTRIEFKRCECGILWNSWKNKKTDWKKYTKGAVFGGGAPKKKGGDDLTEGWYESKLDAYKDAEKACKEHLNEWTEANKADLEQ